MPMFECPKYRKSASKWDNLTKSACKLLRTMIHKGQQYCDATLRSCKKATDYYFIVKLHRHTCISFKLKEENLLHYLPFNFISSFACYFFYHIDLFSEDALCLARDVKTTKNIKLTFTIFHTLLKGAAPNRSHFPRISQRHIFPH